MRIKPTLISMIAVISSAVVFFTAQTVFAATFTVTNTNDAGAGSLRQAILDANAAVGNDVIDFDSSFSVPRTITLSSRITVTGNGGLTLNGPGPDLLTVSGVAGTRLFELSGFGAPNIGAIVFNDLTLADANCTSSQCGTGAAIGTNGDNTGTGEIPATINFTANNLVFRNNNAGVNLGGGIALRRTVASINNSTFTRNTSNGGTAITAVTNTVVTINNSSFFENTRNGGDNVVLIGGTASSVVIANSAIFNNGNPTASAAVRIGSSQAGDHSITNTTIANNIGVFAGVSYDTNNNQISLTLTNVTIAGNRSPSGNTAAGFNSANINTVNVRNTIIANNYNPNGPADLGDGPSSNFNSQGYNLIESIYSGTIQGDTTGNQIGVDPRLDGLMRDNGGPTRTMALRPGSPAIDAGDPATFPPADQRGIARPQDGDGTAGAIADIGAYERRTTDNVAAAPFDFEGDGKTDVSIYRTAAGEWWWSRSSDGQVPALQFGGPTDVITPGDYTGDGKMDIAFFRPSNGFWNVLRSEDFTYYAFPFGTNGDVPVTGDYDGDGKDDVAVFRPSNSGWFISRSSDGGTTITSFGAAGDVPVTADYDGDGTDDIGIYRPNGTTGGEWWISRSSAGLLVTQFGTATDKTVAADYTGDGKADIAFWRPSTGGWYVLRSEDFSFYSFVFGQNGDVPAPGDYDGDGKIDAAVFRSGTWYIARTLAGVQIVGFGSAGDKPVPSAFVR